MRKFEYLSAGKVKAFINPQNINPFISSGSKEKNEKLQLIQANEESIRTHILRKWPRDRIIIFAKHLLGDECQNKVYCPKV